MKLNSNHRIASLMCLLSMALFFSSCHEEIESVYDQLEGSWTITGVSQAHPQSLLFSRDLASGIYSMGCEVSGTESSLTPTFGDGDGTFDVEAFKDDNDTIVRFYYEYYDYDDEYWVEDHTDFIYSRIDPNTMQMTETNHLFQSNNRTFLYIRR